MMNINDDFLHWFINFLIKKTSGSGIKNECAWVIPLKYQKGITITNAFQKSF